ncbi:MAG: TetR/AcrR family transcriptional regulator [Mycobacterium sp.]|nr:TetR/AcrR family transcriptional regulator [Mycobacterium sp.]
MPARRSQAACDRILDAAGELFALRGVTDVVMNDIAAAAGCSRATLYRHFENREALHTAYVSREAREVNRRLAAAIGRVEDPGERLLEALTHALRLVRENPALSAWFARTPIGADAAEESEVVQALTTGFLLSLEPDDVPTAQRRARWLVRVLTSLLTVPGRDADDERAMLREFVVPTITRIRSAPG